MMGFVSCQTLFALLTLLILKKSEVAGRTLGDENDLHSPAKGCGGKPADIVFLLDGSDSIWIEDFKKQLEFVRQMISAFDISPVSTRVAAMSFGDNPAPAFHLGDHLTTPDARDAVRFIRPARGNTDTAGALMYMREEMFSSIHGGRDGVVRIGIVVTDGSSSSPEKTAMQADLSRKAGIILFAVGVGGGIKESEMMHMASKPEYVFTVEDFDALNSIKNILAAESCKATAAPTVDPPVSTTTREPLRHEACGRRHPADIVYVLPNTAGPDDTDQALAFIHKVSRHMEISGSGVRISVVPKTCYGVSGFSLDAFDQKDYALHFVKKMRSGGTNMADQLRYARIYSFRPCEGARGSVKKMLVVIIDGTKAKSNRIESAMEARKLREDGVEIFVVAVGRSMSITDVKPLASPGDQHLILIKSFEDLQYGSQYLKKNLNKACQTSSTGKS